MQASSLHKLTIVEALDSEYLLGASIRDPASFAPWKAFLAVLYGLSLDSAAAALYTQCTARVAPPRGPSRAAWLGCGRRGGKSFTMALVAVYQALFRDWRPFLSPGEMAVIQIVAMDREQSRIITDYIKGILRAAPLLAQFVTGATASSIDFAGSVSIQIATRSFRSIRGRSVACALLDETAFWHSDDSANPDTEVLNAIVPAMATFGDAALLICGSSPYAKRGILWSAFDRHYGQDNGHDFVWRAATRTMNPTITEAYLAQEFERDPVSAEAEYNCAWRTDVEAYVARDVVDVCIHRGRFESAPMPGIVYTAFVDPSGGSGGDSFTLCIAHRAGDTVYIDALRERRPPYSPDAVVAEFCALLESYRVSRVTGDNYANEWPRERFRLHGIHYEQADKNRSTLYQELLPLLNSGRVALVDNPKLVQQLCRLERRAGSAREVIDHPRGGHDDLAMVISDAVLARSAMRGGGYLPSNVQMPLQAPWFQPGSFSDRFEKPVNDAAPRD
jgi:hypothetical protein